MRKVLLLLMALVLPMVASASSELISGQCGDNATFVLDRYGTLTISGTGAMSGKKPWTSYSTCLTRVIVEEGITSINSSAFYGCSAISYVSLPSTLTTIGSYAFERGLKYGAAIVCSAVAPPTVGEDWIDASRFSGVTFYVPETALETYMTTSPWSQFSKILTFQPSVGLLAGSCGENVSFVLGIDGTLTISGTGWMSGYTTEDTQPWKDFRSFISNVVIGDGVTNIGYNAFYGCHCLSVTIGSAVTGIESRAFYNCQQLCSITCKATDLSSMGSDIFRNVPKDNIVLYVPAALIENAASWWSGLFRIKAIEQPDVIAGLCGEALAYELSSEGTLYIHGATSSYDYTLATQPWADYRGQIKRIELSSHVYSLGAHLFNSCTALKTVVCPVTARTVLGTGTGTFDNVPLSSATLYVLASVLDDYKADDVWKNFGAILPIGSDYIDGIYYSLDNIDNKATVIAGTNKYTGNIVIPSTVSSQGTTYTVTKVASGAFADCVGMTSITIPATVLEMGKGAFSGCTGLTKVYFSSLPHLCSITFGDGGNPLGKAHHLYINGSEVTNVVIPNGVTSIGNYAFDGGSYITSVSIPASVTSIGLAIFEDCDQLSSITVAQGNTAYDSRNNCNAIINKAYNMVWAGCKNTVIPTDVTAVGPYSFYHNGGLTSINIPDNITKIYEGAFEGCSNLQSVTIGAGMQEIERYAFNACSSIKTVYCNATTPPTTGEDVFGGVSTAAATLYVPAAALDPYKAAAPWKNFGTILPMGDTPSTSFQGAKHVFGDNLLQTLSDGRLHTYTYDDNGFLTSIERKTSEGSVDKVFNVTYGDQITFTYSSSKYVITLNKRGFVASCDYLNDNEHAEFRYNDDDQLIYVDWDGHVTNITYTDGNITRVVDGGNVYDFSYETATQGKIENKAHIMEFDGIYQVDLDYFSLLYYGGFLGKATSHLPLSVTTSGMTVPLTWTLDSKGYGVHVDGGDKGSLSWTWADGGEPTPGPDPEPTALLTGKCGDNVNFVLSSDYVLKLSGTGPMYDYQVSSQPWNLYNAQIVTIEIGEGITGIGENAFYGCKEVSTMTLPLSVTAVGTNAFYGCLLRSVVAQQTDPQNYHSAFSNITYIHALLYVPQNTYWDYVYIGEWGTFVHIKEYATTAQARRAYMLADKTGTIYTVFNDDSGALEDVDVEDGISTDQLANNWVLEACGTRQALLNLGADKYARIDENGQITLCDTPQPMDIVIKNGVADINGRQIMLIINEDELVTKVVNARYAVPSSAVDVDALYDLSGRRLTKKPSSGVYIKSGHKYIVK